MRHNVPIIDVWTMASQLTDRHAALEAELLSIIFCDPPAGVAHAKRNGVRSPLFIIDDYYHIWVCLNWAAEKRQDTLAAVRATLLWLSHNLCAGWNDVRVCTMAEMFAAPGGPNRMQPDAIRDAARRLTRVHSALLAAQRNTRDTLRQYESAMSPRKRGAA